MADKIKVETTGDFMLLDITNGQVIEAFGATEVEETSFVQNELERGRLKKTSGPAKEAEKPAPSPVEPAQDTGVNTSSSAGVDLNKKKN